MTVSKEGTTCVAQAMVKGKDGLSSRIENVNLSEFQGQSPKLVTVVEENPSHNETFSQVFHF